MLDDFGHAGRPGKVGGSAPENNNSTPLGNGANNSEEKTLESQSQSGSTAYENLQNKPKYGIINSDVGAIHPVLTNRKTGKKLYTEARAIKITSKLEKTLKAQGWSFDWGKTQRAGFQVHALYEAGTDNILGLFSTKDQPDSYFIEIDIAETNPKNRGKDGKYKNTALAMFANVAAESFKKGYDGFVKWKAKSNLIKFYEQQFNVTHIDEQNMFIDRPAAIALLERFGGS